MWARQLRNAGLGTTDAGGDLFALAAPLMLMTACGGGIATGVDLADADAEVQAEAATDAATREEGGPKTCADVGKGPWTDSCCNGSYCNGFCTGQPSGGYYCYCTSDTLGGCPSAAVCCPPQGPDVNQTCALPADCHSCADVGKGAGVEDCCKRPDGPYFCWGRCDGPGGACECGSSSQQGCRLGQTCCALDGGLACVDGLKCH